MKAIKNNYIYLFILLCAVAFVTVSCDEDPGDALQDIIKDDLGYVPRIASFTIVPPGTATVAPGQSLVMDLRYWSEGTISGIEFYRIEGETETRIADLDYSPAYSKVTRTDSLRFTYEVPGDLAPGAKFGIQARIANQGLENYPAKSALLNLTVQ